MTLLVNVLLMGVVFIVAATLKAKFGTQVTSVAGAGEGTIKPQAFDAGLVTGVAMVYFQSLLLLGVTVFFSVFLTPTVNFFMSGAVFFLGNFSSVLGSLASNPERLSPIMRMLYKVLHTILPNFGYYNVQNPIIHPDVQIHGMAAYVAQVIAYAFLYSLVLILIGIFIFDRREFE